MTNGQLKLASVEAASSKSSPMIQLADIVAGAINRHINHAGKEHFKDRIADMIIDAFGLDLGEASFSDMDSVLITQ